MAKIIPQKANEHRFRCAVGPFLQFDRRQPLGSKIGEERLRAMAMKYYESMLLAIEYREEESNIEYCRKITESYINEITI